VLRLTRKARRSRTTELGGWVRDNEPVLFARLIGQVQEDDMFQALAVERARSGERAIAEGLMQLERDIAEQAGDETLLEAMRRTARIIRKVSRRRSLSRLGFALTRSEPGRVCGAAARVVHPP
jgi:hypothetical protein